MKIQKITLNNFRGFPGPLDYEFKLNGKNLLLFGENGSGKSSLYRALVELFRPEVLPPLTFPIKFPTSLGGVRPFSSFRNTFTKDHAGQPLNTGRIQIEFDQPGLTAEWSESLERSPLAVGAPLELNLTARSIGCLDYRAMLETNFVHRRGRVNLFSLIVGDLLFHTSILGWSKTAETLGVAWKEVKQSKPSSHRGRRWKDRVENAEKFWNATLPPLLGELTGRVNELLATFSTSGMSISLTPSTLKYSTGSRMFEGQEVWLDVTLHGQALDEPQNFLNEARLSALALALFLAGYELSIPKPKTGEPDRARVLVLDDVLIGLDYSNRLPLLQLLEQHFQDWQVLLFTHDPIWFEMAKEFTELGANWAYSKLDGVHDAGEGVAYPRLHQNPKDDVAVAKIHFSNGDLKASAVYTRSAFEAKVRVICKKKGVKVPYQSNPKEVKVDTLWTGIKDKNIELQAVGKPPLVEAVLVNQIETVRSIVLNQLSHSQPSSVTSTDLGLAIVAVETLCLIQLQP